jgi:hypothetical protein
MNVNIRLANGRTFRFGYVERCWSDGRRVCVYAVVPGDVVTLKHRDVPFDEVSGFALGDVRELALDEELETRRFAVL